MVSISRIAAAALLVAFAAGCGSSLSIDAVSQPQAEVRAAEEAGAQDVPQAALHLKMAKDQLSVGDRAAADGHDQQATRAYARAKADAELAVLLARHAAVKKKLDEATQKTNALASGGPAK
jgi:hypothetical protein